MNAEGVAYPGITSPTVVRGLIRASVVGVGVLLLASASAVAGRAWLPHPEVVFSRPTPPIATDAQRTVVLERRRDFDALAASIRDAADDPDGFRVRASLLARLITFRAAVGSLPVDDVGAAARGHYIDAGSRLNEAAGLLVGSFNASRVRDLVNQAQAAWRKGDDLLR